MTSTDRPHRVTAADLVDGDVFSLDFGATWHTCAVNMSAMGTVAVYTDDRRDDDAPTVRLWVSDGDYPIVVVR